MTTCILKIKQYFCDADEQHVTYVTPQEEQTGIGLYDFGTCFVISQARLCMNEVTIEDHQWSHTFTDVSPSVYERPHYHGPNGEHIFYP